MKCPIALAALLVVACGGAAPTAQTAEPSEIRTVTTVAPRPADLAGPPVLQDEAPPPKPKAMPWEKPTVVVLSPEDEKLRASLPFAPAIAMDPVDGGKISMRATTPTFEYEGKIYYFSSEANRRAFAANPAQYLKSGDNLRL